MLNYRLIYLTGFMAIFFSGIAVVEAGDISTLQSAVTYAREGMEKAKADHEAKSRTSAQQQKIVDDKRKQLADESSKLEKSKGETDLAWKAYLTAKQTFDKAQSALDAAWPKDKPAE
jgi:hypothetical protein